MHFARFWIVFLLALAGCGGPQTVGVGELNARVITLPDGREIRAEVLTEAGDIQRGMMFRDALPQGRGLLFIHRKPGAYRYWMYNVKAPLDIVFMDANRQIVEISANTPPCTTQPKDCVLYGGHFLEQYVLELRGGEARRLGLRKGQTLSF